MASQPRPSPEPDSFVRGIARIPKRLQHGDVIGNFQIVAKLGEGGMGTVYAALDLKQQREVALKVLAVVVDGEHRRRFVREAAAAASVRHRNIVTIFEVGEDEAWGFAFIAMELIRGKTVRALLGATGPLTFEEAVHVVRGVASGLAAAHLVEVIHRDVKPENVMVAEDGRVILLDFGLAKVANELRVDEPISMTKDGRMLGTPSYMSPEQSHGRPGDARSDIFSLGVLFYELLSGQRPFNGSTTLDVLIALNRDVPTPLWRLVQYMPPAVEHVVQRSLQKDPDARYANGHEFLGALQDAISSPPNSYGVLNSARRSHVMSPLRDGRVLLAGGSAGGVVIDSAEVYCPIAGRSSPAPVMGATEGGRLRATATLLSDGTVLVAGGMHRKGSQNSAQVYDPDSNLWQLPFSYMNHYRNGHTATLLRTGEVFVTGGYGGGRFHEETEIYHWQTRRWTSMRSMSVPRQFHTATVLPGDKVLVIGGYRAERDALATTEMYDLATDNWTTAAPLNIKRARHTATLLTNGSILVAGGMSEAGVPLDSEVYDPVSGHWQAIPMLQPRWEHSATCFPDGYVVVAGGCTDPGRAIGSVELYEPSTRSWVVGTPMGMPRAGHAAVLLEDLPMGPRILITGGSYEAMTLHSSELIALFR